MVCLDLVEDEEDRDTKQEDHDIDDDNISVRDDAPCAAIHSLIPRNGTYSNETGNYTRQRDDEHHARFIHHFSQRGRGTEIMVKVLWVHLVVHEKRH